MVSYKDLSKFINLWEFCKEGIFMGWTDSYQKKKVLFLCTGNSCRSQMAEAWTRHLWQSFIEPYSAGVVKKGLDPYSVKVMKEVGIDISHQYSKTVDELPEKSFDLIVTVCDHAREHCPFWGGNTKIIHQSFDDPPYLTQSIHDEEEKLKIYRRVRDEIRDFILQLDKIM